MSISVQNVTKVYGSQKALDDVSFEVNKGEVLGFLGPNGAGKSTMMKIISCFLPPTSGVVNVCGHDITEESMQVRKFVGYLPESNPLYYDMYVKEYLGFVAGVYGLSKEVSRIKEMIDLTGLGNEQHKQIGQLSKGYKQRVGIAQALIHDPEVLVLDEPTSGLDPNQLVDIRGLIKDLGKNKTVMFSSHIMQEVEAVCDRVIILDRGKVVSDDKTNEVSTALLEQVLLVEFDQAPNTIELNAIDGVVSIQDLGSNKFRIVSRSADDLRVPVSSWAQKKGVLVLEMSKDQQRLEEVFQKLTGKKQ